ncbi:MAG TPA: YbaB/EbfC family nucleoid-associated protein [Micromonosporaceae bacterium]
MIGDLRKSIDNMGDVQRQLMRVTGTAWSDDRLIKAVVGPRGQLLELEIDPRVYRAPNSKALAATIVATVHAAVENVLHEGAEILDANLPRDAGLGLESPAMRMARQHDADVLAEADTEDE